MSLAGGLILLGRDLAATTVYSESEADVYLQCAGNGLCDSGEFRMGDFDGDHFEDLLSPIYSGYGSDLGNVVFGGDYPSGGATLLLRNTTIDFGDPSSSRPRMGIGDITGDGKEDIFFVRSNVPNICYMTLGRPNPPAIISPPADLTIDRTSYSSPMAFGDVNGDGLKDVLFYDGTAYVVFGSTSFNTFTSTISVSDPAHVMTILGGGLGTIASGDVDGDGYDDILLGDIKSGGGGSRIEPGVVYVIRGSSSLPSVWDLRTRSADWTIVGEGVGSLDVNFAADFTGDGKADIGLSEFSMPVMVSGADIISKGPVFTLTPGLANSLTPSSLPIIANRSGVWLLPRDFDGDGRPDLCVHWSSRAPVPASPYKYEISLILSHSFPTGSPLPEVFAQDSIKFTNTGDETGLGDLNGDGKSDLIYKSETFPLLNVFYGYRPLENPKIVVLPRGSIQVRVQMELSVDGEPTEMKVSGDITDNFKDQWIPFQPRLEVTFSSEEEAKEVTAQFRNAFGRESEAVSAPWSVAVGNSGVVTGTNLLRRGGLVTFDCPVDASGSLRASVYDSNGELVLDLLNQSVERGVYPVQWDGRNGQGYSVGKGVYFLVIDVNGGRTQKEILVE